MTLCSGSSAAFSADGRALFYVAADATRRPARWLRHALGTDPAGDALVYAEPDPMFELQLARSRSGAYVFATSRSTTTTEVRFVRADRPDMPPVLVEPRADGHEYHAHDGGDGLYIRTNAGAPNFRLVRAGFDAPGRDGWVEVVPERADVVLDGVQLFARHAVLREREDGVPGLRIVDLATRGATVVAMAEPLRALSDQPNPDFAARSFRYAYESPITPTTIIEVDLSSGRTTVLKTTEVIGHERDRYTATREHAVAGDGTRIPLTIVRRTDTPLGGASPMLLYAYGAYGWPVDDGFSSDLFSLLDRGVVYAVAHVRGGGEFGARWHEGGRLLCKRNTFTDFVASAEHLVARGYAARDRLVVHGLSAGGLTIGAAVMMRPDLFCAAVAQAPFVDVTNTMLDPTLPGTAVDYGEWGDPSRKEYYDYITGYSPYDTIAARAYPPFLVTTAIHDGQVPCWIPATFVAKLRATRTDDVPDLLCVNLGPGGHMGATGLRDRIADEALRYAFVLTHVGRA